MLTQNCLYKNVSLREASMKERQKKTNYVNVCVSSPSQCLTVAHHDIKGQTKCNNP